MYAREFIRYLADNEMKDWFEGYVPNDEDDDDAYSDS